MVPPSEVAFLEAALEKRCTRDILFAQAPLMTRLESCISRTDCRNRRCVGNPATKLCMTLPEVPLEDDEVGAEVTLWPTEVHRRHFDYDSETELRSPRNRACPTGLLAEFTTARQSRTRVAARVFYILLSNELRKMQTSANSSLDRFYDSPKQIPHRHSCARRCSSSVGDVVACMHARSAVSADRCT